jgi:predicted cupin superfamily sugar epimerase
MRLDETIINQFDLQQHPEGGYFSETYRAEDEFLFDGNKRAASTAIYFLLNQDEPYSHFHKIDADEQWHFYADEPIHVYYIDQAGKLMTLKCGNPTTHPEALPQITIPKSSWFAAEIINPESYAFVGCTVAPGFEFAGFELAKGDELAKQFPEHATLIHRLS